MKKILSMAAILVINPIISMEQSISTTIDASKLASACCIATEFFREGYRKFPLNFNEMLSLGDICGLGKLLRLSHVKNIVDAHLGKLSSASQVIIEFSLMENNTLHPLSVCQNIYRFLWYSDTRSFFASNLIVETVDSAISHQCMSEED
ncbi:MAG: hypothetical protein LBB63_01825, partial [Holosporaceae bacterium]|nr:hypothetical protein [Holosporaceae bacterium]